MHDIKPSVRFKNFREMGHRFTRNFGIHTTSPEQLKQKYGNDISQYINLDGVTIHYQIEGEGPTLILAHGVMASLHTWDGWVEALKDKYRIIRFDIPGFGLSDPNQQRQLNPEYAVYITHAFVNALGLDTFYLAGNSLGGFLAWNYAAAHPERVKKMILLDPIGYEQKLPWVMKIVTWPIIRFFARLTAPKFIVDYCVRMVYGKPENIKHGIFDRYFDLLSYPGGRDAMVDLFLVFKFYNGHPDIAAKIKSISVPTLLMWGEKDAWVPVSLVDSWKKDIAQLEAIIYANVGHVPMEEIPQQTALDADRFLTEKVKPKKAKAVKDRQEEPAI